MAKKKIAKKPFEQLRTFRKELIQQLLTLATSAFGFVAALAWNEAIQQAVKDYLEPKIPYSGIFSRLLYAILVTILGVLITFQLSRLATRWGVKK